MKAEVFIEYKDGSEWNFSVETRSIRRKSLAEIAMITRGALMVSTAVRATAYDEDGFDICAYIK